MSIPYSYFAGLFDGEGTITLVKTGKTRKLSMSVSSTRIELLTPLKEEFGGSISEDKTNCALVWKTSGEPALKFLVGIHEWLREPEKKRRADLVLARYTQERGTPQFEEFIQEFFKNSLVWAGHGRAMPRVLSVS